LSVNNFSELFKGLAQGHPKYASTPLNKFARESGRVNVNNREVDQYSHSQKLLFTKFAYEIAVAATVAKQEYAQLAHSCFVTAKTVALSYRLVWRINVFITGGSLL